MATSRVSLAWAPGERLLAGYGSSSHCAVDVLPTLPQPFLKMFFSAHSRFVDRTISITSLSTEYLNLIEICAEELEELQLDLKEEKDKYRTLINDLRHAINVWSLIDAIFISSIADQNSHLSHFLFGWFKLNYPDQMASSNTAQVISDPDETLWIQVTKSLMHGDIAECQQRLSDIIRKRQINQEHWQQITASIHLGQPVHVPEDISPFVLVKAILEAAPEHNLSTRADNSWSTWQDICARWAEFPLFDKCLHGRRLLKVISGDIESIGNACGSWEEMFVACAFLLREESVSGGHLQGDTAALAEACGMAAFKFDVPTSVAGGALVEVALGNLHAAIVRLHETMPSSWFAAHLSDLLVRGGKLNDSETNGDKGDNGSDVVNISIREVYIKEFAASLERYRSCWRIAVDYLSSCPTHGTGMMIDMLGRIPLDGVADRTIEKALRVCMKRNMRRTAVRICERVAVRCLQAGSLGCAVAWFARMHLRDRCTEVTRLAVERAEQGGPLSEGARQLEAVASAIDACNDNDIRHRLDYAKTYYTLQEMQPKIKAACEAEDFDDAAEHAQLFADSARLLVAPSGAERSFWVVIAYEVAKVLDLYPAVRPQFSRKALVEILNALELAAGPYCAPDLIKGLRWRIANDSFNNSSEPKSCSMDRACAELDHCRMVFMECLAKRINER